MRFAFPRSILLLAALGLAAVAVTAIAARPRPQAAPPPVAVATPIPAAAPAAPVAEAVATPAAQARPQSIAPAADAFAPGTAGMRVQLDPETGGLAPAKSTSSMESAEALGLSHSSEGLRQVVLPDGSVMVDLEGRFQEYAIMEIGPDGRKRMRCVQQPQQLQPATPRVEELK